MSYEIVYDRLAIKVAEDKYILLIQAGSNNCWEDSRRPEKHWWTYPMDTLGGNSNNIPFATEQEIAAQLEADVQKFAGESGYLEIFKTRHTPWKAQSFVSWIKNAVKKAVTVEDLIERNYLWLRIEYPKNGLDGSDGFKYSDVVSVETTKELVSFIKGYHEDKTAVRLWWDLPRDLCRPKVIRNAREKQQTDHYFVIHSRENPKSCLYKKTARGIYYTSYAESAKKFLTEKQALSYVKKYNLTERAFNGQHYDEIQRIDKIACL